MLAAMQVFSGRIAINAPITGKAPRNPATDRTYSWTQRLIATSVSNFSWFQVGLTKARVGPTTRARKPDERSPDQAVHTAPFSLAAAVIGPDVC
jgi:hypothetical protein